MWLRYSPTSNDAAYPVREMLVNSAGGFVRRSTTGDLALFLTDTIGWTATGWSTIVLTLLACVLFTLAIIIYRHLPDDPALVPLVLTPLGLMFYSYDADVMIRKEAFGYIALAIVLGGTFAKMPNKALCCLLISCLLMPLSILAHEINAIFAGPLVVATFWLIKKHPQIRIQALMASSAATVASILSVVAVSLHMTASPEAICAAVGDLYCHAPYSYFNDSAQDAKAYVADQIEPAGFALSGILICIALFPFAGLKADNGGRNWIIMTGAVTLLPILPLFILAADHGRWIAMIVVTCSLMAATALGHGKISYRRVCPSWLACAFCGSWSLYHFRVEIRPDAVLLWAFLLGAISFHFLFKTLLPAQQSKAAS